MIYLALLGCVFFVFLQGLFAAGEISFISSSLLKLRHRAEKKERKAEKAYALLLEPEKFLVTTLVGTNISVVLSTSLLTFSLINLGLPQTNLWITVFFTPLVVIFAELVPKSIGRAFREDLSCRIAGPIIFFERIFSPLTLSVNKVSNFLIKVFIGKARPRSLFVTKEEIKSLIKEIEKEGGIDRGEKEAIEEVFEFRQSKIKDVCTAFKNAVTLDYAAPYGKILEAIREHGFTRYPVLMNKEVVGYINIYDLFYNPVEKWQSLVRVITKVGVNQRLDEVFSTLKAKKEKIALVFKGKRIWGIVTLQDLIGEVLNSIIKI